MEIDCDWSESELAIFVELADQACVQLSRAEVLHAEDTATWRVLNDATISLRGAAELRTAPIVELGRAVIALAQGTLPEPPLGMLWFFGTPEGRSTIQMRAPP